MKKFIVIIVPALALIVCTQTACLSYECTTTDPDCSPAWLIWLLAANTSSVAPTSDFNGDGYSDLAVGATQNDDGINTGEGSVHIYYGGPDGIVGHPSANSTYTCSGPPDCTELDNPNNEGSGNFGTQLAGVGDVNGDGFGDLAVGAPNNDDTVNNAEGAVYVFYGSASGITNHPRANAAYTCTGPPDCTVLDNPNNAMNGRIGTSIGAAGDVNGDGFADIVVGSRNDDATNGTEGTAYIFYGSATGITNHPIANAAYACNGPPDCSVLGNPLNQAGAQFSNAVAGGGDVNGDGFTDVVIGAFRNDDGPTTDEGAAYIFYGSASGVVNHPIANATYTCSGPPDCSVLDNPNNQAAGGSGSFGSGVAMGDVNGDGFADAVIGANNNSDGVNNNEGAAYVFYGSASGVTNHPLANATYTCNGPPDCSVVGNPNNETSGGFGLLLDVGDLNGDGRADVSVAAAQNDDGVNGTEGAVYVFFGGVTGITNHPIANASYPCNGPPDCSAFDNPQNRGLGRYGESVAAGGDYNADGFQDLLVGARGNQDGANANEGAAYVHYGGATGPVNHPLANAAYSCTSVTDCIEIDNPYNENGGRFGAFVK